MPKEAWLQFRLVVYNYSGWNVAYIIVHASGSWHDVIFKLIHQIYGQMSSTLQ